MKNLKQLIVKLTTLFDILSEWADRHMLSIYQSVFTDNHLGFMYGTSIVGIYLETPKQRIPVLLNKIDNSLNKCHGLLNRHLFSDKDWLNYNNTNLEIKSMACDRELTERELEILSLVSRELSSDEIADQLILSKHTIISHRKKLLLKMGVKNTAGMIRKGFELGYLSMTKRS